MADAANHIFLPWVQPGVAVNIPDQSTDTLKAGQPSIISLPVRLIVNTDTVEKTVRLYGPGDVTGIDAQQVVRVEPRHRTTDFEPNYFPAIEFDRPDFPWLFTPAKGDAQGRLRPWLCLVIVRKQQGVKFNPGSDQPLPVLEIKAPARPADELPDLSESHFWAHAQVTGADKSQIKTVLASDPARSVSRLLCPRRLDPVTDYIACVVPAFGVGRKAGLKLPDDPADNQKLEPAWLSGAQAPIEVTLPVYYSWEFRTAAGGDFEDLVQRLERRELPVETGKRPMDISHSGLAMEPQPNPAEMTLGLEGALRIVDARSDPWSDNVRLPFQAALQKILNAPWDFATQEGSDSDPIVGPPIYGCWQAAVHQVGARTAPPPPPIWLDELNLDPRHRAVAAMGAQVVQKEQELLMASAWEQLGDIERVNQRLRQAQLSRALNDKYHVKSFSRFSEEAFLNIVAPARSRIVVQEHAPSGAAAVTMLLSQKLAGSFVPPTAVSAPLRKMARPRGAINRQYLEAGATRPQAVFNSFNIAGPSAPTAPTKQNRGAVTVDQVSEAISRTGLFFNPTPPAHWDQLTPIQRQMLSMFRLSSLGAPAMALNLRRTTGSAEFADAVMAHHDYLTRVFTIPAIVETRNLMSTQDMKTAVMFSLDPARTVSHAALSSLQIRSRSSLTGDELEPIMDAPSFPQPMYQALRDLSQDYLFPGLEHVLPNTVQLLATNAKFIEAFMVGLNAEMSRELLWRDYPTDQRATYFQQFWDTAGAGAQSRPDIIPIHQWGGRALGMTAGDEPGGDKLVLLVRGDLLRRYPSAVIYAVKAVLDESGKRALATDHPEKAHPPLEAYPIFRGTLEPDVTFIGFDLTQEEIVADTGWFFVLQQQPTEPRFGLDKDPFGEGESGIIPELKTWNDLNWAHLAPSAEKLRALAHVSVNGVQLVATDPGKVSWGRNAAHMASITKQLPARVAIHATELLSETVV